MKVVFVKEYPKYILIIYQDGTIEEYDPLSDTKSYVRDNRTNFSWFLFSILAIFCCIGTIPFALITALVIKMLYG